MSTNAIAPVQSSAPEATSTNHTQKTDVAGVVANAENEQMKLKKNDVAGILAFGQMNAAPEGARDLAIA